MAIPTLQKFILILSILTFIGIGTASYITLNVYKGDTDNPYNITVGFITLCDIILCFYGIFLTPN